MLTTIQNHHLQVSTKKTTLRNFPHTIVIEPDHKLIVLLSALSPATPWGQRQIAAQKLGNMRSSEALPALLAALPKDSFWMVRCAIIQALEKIRHPGAIPTLREVSKQDNFQVVRSYAATRYFDDARICHLSRHSHQQLDFDRASCTTADARGHRSTYRDQGISTSTRASDLHVNSDLSLRNVAAGHNAGCRF